MECIPYRPNFAAMGLKSILSSDSHNFWFTFPQTYQNAISRSYLSKLFNTMRIKTIRTSQRKQERLS